jgi:hypothetical protein
MCVVMYVCVRGIDFVSVRSTIFVFEFGTVPTDSAVFFCFHFKYFSHPLILIYLIYGSLGFQIVLLVFISTLSIFATIS